MDPGIPKKQVVLSQQKSIWEATYACGFVGKGSLFEEQKVGKQSNIRDNIQNGKLCFLILPGFFINCHFILNVAVLVAIAVCDGVIHLSNIIH